MTTLPPLLRISDATVRKGHGAGRVILDRISLEIRDGQHTVILGPNGSGKSSLIKLITHEYRPLARPDGPPAIEVFGRSRWNVTDLRRILGIVSSDLQRDFLGGAMAASLRGIDTVLTGFYSGQALLPTHPVTSDMRARAVAALVMMDAEHLAQKPLRHMSTGEQRRTLIARALVTKPHALLLDEPTSGLDLGARHAFLERVRGLAQAGTTIVMVTHRPDEIIPETSHAVLLRDGRILSSGDPSVVLTAPQLSTAFGVPVCVHRVAGGYYDVAVARHGDPRTQDRSD